MVVGSSVRFEALYRAHAGVVRAYALRRTAGGAADDVVAEVFLVAWRRLDEIPDDPVPWLLGIARRVLANMRRGASRKAALEGKLMAHHPVSALAPSVADRDDRVARCLNSLGEPDREALLLARHISGAAGYFAMHRLPELYAGLEREPASFPVQYKGANAPQAWAAGSCFSMLQTLVGFQPNAPQNRLYIDPVLPDWLPDLELRDVRVGTGVFDLRLWREGPKTAWEVTRGDASFVQRRSYARGPKLWRADGEDEPQAMSV